jgi:hypothetical protein
MTPTPATARPDLPELPLEAWEPTKTTLHLWAQIVGKVKLAATAPRNHWWNVPLYLDVRGLTTRRLHHGQVSFQIDFDFVDHRLVAQTNRGQQGSFRLHDGLSVASFDRQLHQLLDQLGVDVAIREDPYGVPMTTPFPNDTEHAAYDPEYVRRFWQVLDLGGYRARGVLGLVLRQAEPGPPVLARLRPGGHSLLRPPGPGPRGCRPGHS